jgi:hypothetical protein
MTHRVAKCGHEFGAADLIASRIAGNDEACGRIGLNHMNVRAAVGGLIRRPDWAVARLPERVLG